MNKTKNQNNDAQPIKEEEKEMRKLEQSLMKIEFVSLIKRTPQQNSSSNNQFSNPNIKNFKRFRKVKYELRIRYF